MVLHPWEVMSWLVKRDLWQLVLESEKTRPRHQGVSSSYALPHSCLLLNHFHSASCSLQGWKGL